MKKTTPLALLFLATATGLGLSTTLGAQKALDERRYVDLAICLDTSGSMRGLLDSARQSIWAIVNDLALAKPAPRLRIALLTFGNDGHSKANGWVRVDTGFTGDLDLVSEKLFALKTNGGTELVGRVLQASLEQLRWTSSSNALKLIVVAGNESADQDRMVDFRSQCKKAIPRGIMINSIYCGNPGDQLAPAWNMVAKLADGHFDTINQHGTVALQSPFDAQITSLSSALNTTYIPLGAAGARGNRNQIVQDGNAVHLNSQASAQRGQAKASGNYYCSWDLIDNLRRDWASGKLPVYFVQLPNFKAPQAKPNEENTGWPLCRESFTYVAINTPNTGMVVTIDIGEEKDIHPKNKQDIGRRMASTILNRTYGKNTPTSPICTASKTEGDKVVLFFEYAGSGLTARGGKLKSFAIAGADKKFVWADAVIEKRDGKDVVVVSSPAVKKPASVRYAWAWNPDRCNLYSKEGFPASPFRTDQWSYGLK